MLDKIVVILGAIALVLASSVFCNVQAQQQAIIGGMEMNTDRPGMDYKNFNLSSPEPKLCESSCQQDTTCKAWTYVKPGVQGQYARCWLKSGVPALRLNNCCISGVMSSKLKALTPITIPNIR